MTVREGRFAHHSDGSALQVQCHPGGWGFQSNMLTPFIDENTKSSLLVLAVLQGPEIQELKYALTNFRG